MGGRRLIPPRNRVPVNIKPYYNKTWERPVGRTYHYNFDLTEDYYRPMTEYLAGKSRMDSYGSFERTGDSVGAALPPRPTRHSSLPPEAMKYTTKAQATLKAASAAGRHAAEHQFGKQTRYVAAKQASTESRSVQRVEESYTSVQQSRARSEARERRAQSVSSEIVRPVIKEEFVPAPEKVSVAKRASSQQREVSSAKISSSSLSHKTEKVTKAAEESFTSVRQSRARRAVSESRAHTVEPVVKLEYVPPPEKQEVKKSSKQTQEALGSSFRRSRSLAREVKQATTNAEESLTQVRQSQSSLRQRRAQSEIPDMPQAVVKEEFVPAPEGGQVSARSRRAESSVRQILSSAGLRAMSVSRSSSVSRSEQSCAQRDMSRCMSVDRIFFEEDCKRQDRQRRAPSVYSHEEHHKAQLLHRHYQRHQKRFIDTRDAFYQKKQESCVTDLLNGQQQPYTQRHQLYRNHPIKLPMDNVDAPLKEGTIWPQGRRHFDLVSSYDVMLGYLGVPEKS